MTATTLDSIGPTTKTATPVRRTAAAPAVMPAPVESGAFIDQSAVYGRLQPRKSNKPTWLIAPVAIAAVIGAVMLTNKPAEVSQTETTTTTLTAMPAAPAVMPSATPPVASTSLAPTPPAAAAPQRMAALDRPAPAPRRPAATPTPERELESAPLNGFTANVAEPVPATPEIAPPVVALTPPPIVTPGPDTAEAQVAPPMQEAPVVGPLAATPAPPADTL